MVKKREVRMRPASKQGFLITGFKRGFFVRGVVYALVFIIASRLLGLDELSWGESILIAIVGGVVIALLLEPVLRKIYPYRRDHSDK